MSCIWLLCPRPEFNQNRQINTLFLFFLYFFYIVISEHSYNHLHCVITLPVSPHVYLTLCNTHRFFTLLLLYINKQEDPKSLLFFLFYSGQHVQLSTSAVHAVKHKCHMQNISNEKQIGSIGYEMNPFTHNLRFPQNLSGNCNTALVDRLIPKHMSIHDVKMWKKPYLFM